MSTIIFVCTGNTCRSPMAESFAKARFGGRHVFASRGLFVTSNRAESHAVTAAENAGGTSLAAHQPTQLTKVDVDRADFIITMTEAQKHSLLGEYPVDCAKFSTLASFAPNIGAGDVSDPFGGDLDTYTRCAEQIKKYIYNMEI